MSGNGFQVNNPGPSRFTTDASQISNDLTLVRGGHQLGFGATIAKWSTYIETCARCGGQWNFNGQVTGLGLSDFLLGRVATMELCGPGGTDPEQWYIGMFAQDSWRATNRLTLNLGLRWEPFFGQHLQGRFGIPIWSWENFRNGVRSSQFVNAPHGFLYAGDPGLATTFRSAISISSSRRRRPSATGSASISRREALTIRMGMSGAIPIRSRRTETRFTHPAARSASWPRTSTRRACSRGT